MHASAPRLHAGVLACLLAVGLAGCGSTVPLSDRAQGQGSGLTGGQANGAGLVDGPAGSGGTSLPAGQDPSAVDGGSGPLPDVQQNGGSAPGAGSLPSSTPGAVAPTRARVTSPVTVGFVSVDYTKAISALGGSSSGDRSIDRFFKDYVAAFKVAGGLGGRPIKPLYYVIDGTASNYETEFAAACAYLTQDNKVDMVATLGMVVPSFSKCLASRNVPEYNGMSWTLPRAQLDRTPGFFGPVGLSHEQVAASTVDTGLRQGWIKKGDKVGIVVDGCPEHQAVAKQIVQPRLSKAGITSVTVVPYGCPKGFSSLGEMSSGMQSAVLRFRSEGVKTVMYVTYVENVAHSAFVNQAESQNYVPNYLLSTTVLLQASLGNMPERQRVGMRGIGWQPVTDLYIKPAAPSPARTACNDLLKRASVPLARNSNELDIAFTVCDLMRLMDAQLRATRGSTRISDLSATRAALKGSYTSALGWGPVDLTDGQGPELAAPFSYRQDCKCVRFDGKPVPLARV